MAVIFNLAPKVRELRMTAHRYRSERVYEDRWGLRTTRASSALGRFCTAWFDAGRDFGFGAAHLVLRTAEDLTDTACGGGRAASEPADRARTVETETVEVRRRAPRA
jgi:hypothetical protein